MLIILIQLLTIGMNPHFDAPSLVPDARLRRLDSYVEGLGVGLTDERTEIRRRIYAACREADMNYGMYACDSPVGTGKTTAVMAHLPECCLQEELAASVCGASLHEHNRSIRG